jgi:phage portal protein BeeE
MICSSVCLFRLIVWSFPQGQTPVHPGSIQGGNVTAYQQVLKGLPAVNYSARDIVYRPRNVRAHKVYGYSPVQQVLMTVNIALRRQLWQLDYFFEGSTR